MNGIHDTMTALYHRAQDRMTPAELEDIASSMLDQAESAARNLSAVTEGIGCLVCHDGMNKTGAGTFQEADGVFRLMWSVSQQLDTIAALICIGDAARQRARPKVTQD